MRICNIAPDVIKALNRSQFGLELAHREVIQFGTQSPNMATVDGDLRAPKLILIHC